MQHVISTRQMFTFESDSGDSIAHWLAAKTNGIYQIDSRVL